MADRPQSVYEDRVNYDELLASQHRRIATTLTELRNQLREIERRTLGWVQVNLVDNKSSTSIFKYSMPLEAKYRAILRKRISAAYRRGHTDVKGELSLRGPAYGTRQQNAARQRADQLATDHKQRLENNLKNRWRQAMQGNVDKDQLFYMTKQVFADFAGWEQP